MSNLKGLPKNTLKYAAGYSPDDIRTRVVKSFLDILILIELKKQLQLSGYDITTFLHEQFGKIISPGTVYATLKSMKSNELIDGNIQDKKTVYSLSTKGQEAVSTMMIDFHEQMALFAQKFLTL